MTVSEVLTVSIAWVEGHAITVDLLKWLAVGVLAWALGVFRFLRTKLKRPKLDIESFTSRCAWQELGRIDNNDHNVRVVFLIEASLVNPTSEDVVVRSFCLKVKRLKRWGVRNYCLNPVTLPSRVRHSVGDIVRYLCNWFSNFPEGPESLTLDSRVESKGWQSGFLLFVSASWGYMRPYVVDGKIPVTLYAYLTTGECLRVNSKISILQDVSVLESMVPGVFEHVKDSRTWNVIREGFK